MITMCKIVVLTRLLAAETRVAAEQTVARLRLGAAVQILFTSSPAQNDVTDFCI